jgi:hypothetical protein
MKFHKFDIHSVQVNYTVYAKLVSTQSAHKVMAILVTWSTLCLHLPSFSPSMLALFPLSLVSLELVCIHSRHSSVLI